MAKKPPLETAAIGYDHGPGPFIEGALPRPLHEPAMDNSMDDSVEVADAVTSLITELAKPLPVSLEDAHPIFHPMDDANRRSAIHIYEGLASCSSCRFMARDSATGMECRRNPPARGSSNGFPDRLNTRTWCGEYLEGATA
jgi:hypothetical protein